MVLKNRSKILKEYHLRKCKVKFKTLDITDGLLFLDNDQWYLLQNINKGNPPQIEWEHLGYKYSFQLTWLTKKNIIDENEIVKIIIEEMEDIEIWY